MGSPEKPFACTEPECGMRFTNEDHLNVHSKKHDLELQLGVGQKSAVFPADQTPTPTRFIRNCEEVGLFQDLQNVNPFDEGFKEAMEKSHMPVSPEGIIAVSTSDDALHTPRIFPSPPDVLGAKNTTKINTDPTTVTHFESTVQTKLTNEITVQENVTTIQSNIEMRKTGYSTVIASNNPNLIKLVVDNSEKDVVRKDVLLTDSTKLPIFSQKSIEEALDSLKSEAMNKERNESLINTLKKNMKSTLKNIDEQHTEVSKKGKKRRVAVENDMYEVILKLPNGELVHMQSSEREKQLTDPKQKLKDAIENKIKNEIEQKIKLDIENKIQSGDFILKVKDPDTINSSITKSTLVNIAPKPNNNLVPLIVTAPNLLIPVQNMVIPQVHVSNSILPVSKIKPPRRRSTNTVNRVTHHKLDCAILQIVGGVCNMNCGDTSKQVRGQQGPDKVDELAEQNRYLGPLQSNGKERRDLDVAERNKHGSRTKMILIKSKTNREHEKKSSHPFNQRHGNQAAVKRYREKQKSLLQRTLKINELVQNENQSLRAELAALKNIITDHCKSCPIADVLRRKLRETQMISANK